MVSKIRQFPSFHYAKLLTYRPFKRPFGSCYKLLLGPTVVVALNSARAVETVEPMAAATVTAS